MTGIAGLKAEFRRWDSGAGTWTKIAKLRSLTGPSMSRGTIDVSAADQTKGYRDFVTDLREAGEMTLSLLFDRSEYELMLTDFESDTAQNYEIVLPDADNTSFEFEGLVTEMPLAIPTHDAVTVDITIKITGVPNIESGSGPSAKAF